MSQDVTLSAMISPAQSLAVEALVSGSTITEAAEEAGVSRETVSRWVHRDPEFIAELQNARAEIAAQTRCALEAIGGRAVATLRKAVESLFIPPTRLRAACAVLKMLGADRAESVPPTPAEEVRLRLQEREEELRKRQSRLGTTDDATGRSIDVTPSCEAAVVTAANVDDRASDQTVGPQSSDRTAHANHQAEVVAVSRRPRRVDQACSLDRVLPSGSMNIVAASRRCVSGSPNMEETGTHAIVPEAPSGKRASTGGVADPGNRLVDRPNRPSPVGDRAGSATQQLRPRQTISPSPGPPPLRRLEPLPPGHPGNSS